MIYVTEIVIEIGSPDKAKPFVRKERKVGVLCSKMAELRKDEPLVDCPIQPFS